MADDLKFDELMAPDPEPFNPKTRAYERTEPTLAANVDADEEMASLSDLNAETHRETPVSFVTGKAGCGKTFTMKKKVEEDRSYGALVASTGIAAVNLGAQTINSLLKYYDTASLKDNYIHGRLQATLRKLALTGIKNIILDEVSMTPKEQLDIIMMGLADTNQLSSVKHPLGLIIVGDFCLGVGTGVMMADGSIKKVEDIIVGDSVMGPDSRPRRVLRTTSGTDELFLVSQSNGDDYVVNSNHQLALIRSKDGSRIEFGFSKQMSSNSRGIRYPEADAGNSHVFMTAPLLASKSQRFRECFVGYKAGLIYLPSRPVMIEPYFLGLWLGDGDCDDTRITTADPEVLEYCGAYARQLGLSSHINGWGDRTKAVRISLTHSRADAHIPNPLRVALKNYGVWKNKHIPEDYLLNSEQVRLEILAGLLDSDGCWNGNRFVLHLSVERLARNAKQLADSLGFRTAFYPSTNAWYKNGANGGAWEVTIGGDTWRIPTRIHRKQSKLRDLVRSRMTSVLDIIPYGVGTYAGFEIDGDHLFCLADGTVTHNCQLSPVKAEYAFKADCWPKFAAATTRLTKNWRQSDPQFLEAINHLRAGNGKGAADLLQGMADVNFHSGTDDNFDGTTIMAKNEGVDRYNNTRLMALSGKTINLRSRQWGAPDVGAWRNIPSEFFLKEGAYVMILSNNRGSGRIIRYCTKCGKEQPNATALQRMPQDVYSSSEVGIQKLEEREASSGEARIKPSQVLRTELPLQVGKENKSALASGNAQKTQGELRKLEGWEGHDKGGLHTNLDAGTSDGASQRLCPGTSVGDGQKAWTATKTRGESTPQECSEGRQFPEESGTHQPEAAPFGKDQVSVLPSRVLHSLGCIYCGGILSTREELLQFANGDTGHVQEFDGKAFHIKLVRNDDVVKIYPIHRTKVSRDTPSEYPNEEDWEIFDSSLGERPPYGRVSYDEGLGIWHTGGIQYYPLRPAYASTVHKSQGLSLDRCQIDIRNAFFGQPSMAYVAVSRCRTPGGLRIVGTAKLLVDRCAIDPEVLPYL
jgi:hypothetical protein